VNWPLADYRYGYIFPDTNSVHTGVDIDAPLNTPIIAAASGTVIWAGYGLLKHDVDKNDPYGQAVAIRHDFGYKGLRLITVYAHMSRVDVKVGQVVSQGEKLGTVGMTGFTTGPHVHFEVRLESATYFSTRNPELWLSPPEGDGLIVGQFQNDYGGNLGAYKVTIVTSSGDTLVGYTYGPNSINSDDYYKENFVQSDLPAGKYLIIFTYLKKEYSQIIEVYPGVISYFIFKGKSGFSLQSPSVPVKPTWLIPFATH
jgi:murein DD-endopeptidase MepM/ murein hydrolase activator NlpD